MEKIYIINEENMHPYQAIGTSVDHLMYWTAQDDADRWMVLTERERQFEPTGWGYFPTEEAAYKLASKLAHSAIKREQRNR